MDISEVIARAPWKRPETPAPQVHTMVLEAFLTSHRHTARTIVLPPAANKPASGPTGYIHAWPEFFLQLSGERRFTFANDRRAVLCPGEICLVPAGMEHAEVQVDRGRGHACLVGMCHRDHLSLHLAVLGPDGVQIGTQFDIYADGHGLGTHQLITELVTAAHDDHDQAGVPAITETLLLHSLRCARGPSLHQVGASPLIDRCLRMLTARLFHFDLSVALLARELGCHPDHLGRMFHAATSETLVGYIARKRMDMAADLLREGRHDVRQVALVCGYRDAAYFSRVFRRCHGTSPLLFKRTLR